MTDYTKFWILFGFINLLSFLPGYFFDFKASSLIPIGKWLSQKTNKQKINYFFVRENQDPFKINGDLISACAALLLIGNVIPERMGAAILGGVLALSFAYLLYYFAMVGIYQTVPVLSNDLQFAKVGLSIATQRFPVLFGLGILVTLGILGVFFYLGILLYEYLMVFTFPDKTYLLIMLVGVYNIYRGRKQKYVIIHKKLLVAPIIHLIKNLKVSKESRAKMKAWEPEFFRKLNVYEPIGFEKKPNIIIASLESYGAIIHEIPELKAFFHPKLEEACQELAKSGWHATSILSKAPRISGGSWLSHSSFLYGMLIDEFAIYESLMNNPTFAIYQSLFHVFKEKGYYNYYLNPLGGYDMSRINWNQISRMFAADKIINDEDIDYKGQRTGSMGDSAPDQYAFRYSYDQIKQEAHEPYAAFFISNNSHYSFFSPKEVEPDWQSLNHPEYTYEQTDKHSDKLLEKYKEAINYQLDIFLDFLKAENPENTMLILFGDHQPPAVTTKDSTFHSPVHILSKDADFLGRFSEFGFRSGLLNESIESGIAHQSFFSLFMKVFIEKYGTEGVNAPPYLPEGHQILG